MWSHAHHMALCRVHWRCLWHHKNCRIWVERVSKRGTQDVRCRKQPIYKCAWTGQNIVMGDSERKRGGRVVETVRGVYRGRRNYHPPKKWEKNAPRKIEKWGEMHQRKFRTFFLEIKQTNNQGASLPILTVKLRLFTKSTSDPGGYTCPPCNPRQVRSFSSQ